MTAASHRVRVATRTSDRRPRLATAERSRATVHSCFRSALNISTPDGLLTVASEAIGGLPNGIVADLAPDFRSLGVVGGMTVEVDGDHLDVPDAGLRVDLCGAAWWSPRIGTRSGADRDAAADRWRRRNAEARSIALDRAAPGGLAGLLRTDRPAGPATLLDVTDRARPVVVALLAALVVDDRATAAARAHALIGLGPGLTPSGDDLLVGLEAALHALGRPEAGFLGKALGDVDERTTVVAGTLLRHAARGEFAERIHRLLDVLLGPDDTALAGAIERAIAWGATSGTDCLVGVLCGLDIGSRRDDLLVS